MKLYHHLHVAIDGIDAHGRGTATVGGTRLAVPFAFPGDEVDARPTHREHGVLVCELLTLTSPSPWRVAARCDHADRSGGCFWQVIAYEKQLEWKRMIAQRCFEVAGVSFVVPEVILSVQRFEFRNKMEFAIGEGIVIGTKALGKWWEIVDMDGCMLLSRESREIVRRVRAFLQHHHLIPWNVRQHEGYARYLVLREGKFTDERMITLITAPGALPAAQEFTELLKPLATSLYHGINFSLSDTAFADTLTLLAGNPYLQERVGALMLSISPNAFFQTNSYMIETLTDTVENLLQLTPREKLLDLYCGLGLFSLKFAPLCAQIIGIEAVREAVAMAIRNQEANNITNVEFKAGKVEDLSWVGPWADAAIVDPPRAGLHPDVVEALVRCGPQRIVYACCNPKAFARELKLLKTAYEVTAVRALDLFPHSPHVELVVRLERA
ncbi:MAG: 23S rRNA (uracil(1939)-C(5))-methyltransferase RlmD [Patescibacteria group bacterium]